MKVHFILRSALLSILALGQLSVFSQEYQLTASAGEFTPLSGSTGTVFNNADDGVTAPIALGFSFDFNGTTYSQVVASTNGFISFNPETSSSYSNNLATTNGQLRPLIAPLWDDLAGYQGNASYKTEGMTPNQIFTFEWLHWNWDWMSPGSVISFQVKLFEGSNEIEFIYRQETGNVNNGSASIGLALQESGFFSLSDASSSPSTSSSVETNNIATKPATGQIYRFSREIRPEPSNHATSFLSVNYGNKITLSWIDATGENLPNGYLIMASTTNTFVNPTDLVDNLVDRNLLDGFGIVKVPFGAQTYQNFINAAFDSTYYFQIIPYSNSGTFIDYLTSGTIPQTSVTCTALAEPTNHATAFSASTNGSNLNLTWTDATGDILPDGYLILVSKTNSFSNPVDGIEQTNDNDFEGDGFCTIKISKDMEEFSNFQNIEPNITYYARIYSYTNFGDHIDYKTDGEIPETTVLIIKPEPTNQATSFAATKIAGTITLTWVDALGETIPDGYLIIASTNSSIVDPTDNMDILADNDVSDGAGIVKVSQGIQTFSEWINADLSETYYFKIYSYTNAGEFINYKVSGLVPVAVLSPSVNFTEVTSAVLTGLYNSGSAEWGDYNNDGFLDIIMTGVDGDGSRASRIYRNNGNETFTDVTGALIGVSSGTAVWADYNNDGYLDIFYSGSGDSQQVAKLLKNNGNGTFTENTNLSLIEVESGSAAFADYNNDGYLDFIYTGQVYYDDISIIYKNNGDETFSEQTSISIPGVLYSSVDWGDFDNDGFVDLIMNGNFNGLWLTKIYRNNRNGNFTELQNTGLVGVLSGSCEWGDYDSDGHLDILVCGVASGWVYQAKVYKNNGDATFTLQTGISLPGIGDGNGTWGDYNNDGYLDILLIGSSNGGKIAKLYKNNGTGGFSEDLGVSLPGVNVGEAKWGDYDNDGDLDILLTGETTDGNRIAKIFRNESLSANQAPQKPTNLQASVVGKNITLSWDVATDNETPSTGLSYNIYVGTTSDKFDIRSPQADTITGLRTIAKRGLIQTNTYQLKNLDGGTYYWSVQAVDNGFAGSEFAEQSSFSIIHFNSIAPIAEQTLILGQTGTPLTVSESLVPDSRQWKYSFAEGGPFDQEITGEMGETYSPMFTNGGSHYVVCVSKFGEVEVVSNCVKVYVQSFTAQVNDPAFPNAHSGSKAWGDYNNDGFLDLLFTGLPGDDQNNEEAISQVYKNNGDGTFSPQSTIELTSVYKSSVDWGDYDNDGLLDILLTGTTENFYTGAISKVYRNNGDNTFTEQTGISLPGVHKGTARWVDFDNNGTLDILLAGQSTNGNSVFTIYKNTNNGFIEHPTNLIPFSNGKFDLGDFNNDGFTDILMSGLDYSGNKLTTIYKNNGDETFTRLSTLNLTSLNWSSVAWGDYDNDGFLDILLSGTSDGWTATTKIFKNNGNETFTEQASISLLGVNMGSVAWGDYNNDGFSDIIINGTIRSACVGGFTKVYKNTGTGSFVEATDVPLPGLTYASSAWGDYDNDGDLDLFISGETISQFTYYSKLYRNNCVQPNQPPTAPENLNSQIIGGKAALSWNRATDAETPSPALTYNLHIARAADTSLVKNPMSDLETGYRKVVGLGNAGNDTTYIAIGLATGSYVWRVQTIDNAFAASSFSEWSDFEILPQFTEKQLLVGYEHALVNWIDYDNDGNLDMYRTGYDGHNGAISNIFKNQGNTSYNFTVQNQISLPSVVAGINSISDGEDGSRINKNGATSWGDYNNDGFLDLLIAGSLSNSNNIPENVITKIFSNNGDGTFSEMTNLTLPKIGYGPSVAWVDIDNDGLQDIFLTGMLYQQFGGSGSTAIFRNNGDSTFTKQTNFWLESVTSGSVDVGDYDNDGYLDLIITGSDRAKLYRNNGNGGFDVVANTPFVPVKHSSVAWGDYNNDGFLDVLLTGMDVNNNRISKIYRNNGNGTFSDINVFMQGMSGGVVSWGDYNNDGLLDILMTGASGNNTNVIFENNGNGTFTEKDFGFDKLVNGYSAFGDFDNDGDLDVITSGKAMLSNNSYTTRTKVHQNNGNYENEAPTAPLNLVIERLSEKYRFHWDAASDDKTPSASLSYNLRIGTVSGGRDVVSPLGFTDTAKMLLPQMGNCQLSRTKTIKSLQPGTYYWSVQAVDQTFKAGQWAEEQVLIVAPMIADFSANTVCHGLETLFSDISITSFEPIVNWKWQFGDGDTAIVQNPTHVFQMAGEHTVTLTIQSASYESTITKTVTVKPRPSANFTAPTVCFGNQTVFTNTSTVPNGLNVTWSWNFGNQTNNAIFNNQSPVNYTYNSAQEFSSKLKLVADNGCSDSITRTVVVVPTPDASIFISSGSNTSFCKNSGDSAYLSVAIQPNCTYQWLNNGIAMNGQNQNFLNIKENGGRFKANVTNTVGGCTVQTSAHIEIFVNTPPNPLAIFYNSDATTFCAGDSLVLETPAIGNVQTLWKRDGNLVGMSNTFVARQTGTYTLTARNPESGCENITDEQVAVVVNPTPSIPSLSYGQTTVCQGTGVNFSTVNNPSLNYQWFRNNEAISGATTNQLTAIQSGEHKLQVSNTGGCSSETEPVAVTVNPIPATPLINQPSSNSICSGDSVLLSISAMENVNYQWKLNGGNVGQNSHQLYAKASGTYSVIVTNTSNCSATSSNTMTITVNDVPTMPSVNFGETTFCQGGSVTFTVTNNPSNTYQWLNGTSEIPSATTNQYLATATGNYKLRVTGAGGCFVLTEPVAVTVNPIPATPLINQPSSNSICSGDSVLLSISAMENVNYQWKLNGGNVGQNSHQLYAKASGTYSVIVTNTSNCSATSSNTITITVNDVPVIPSVNYGETTFCQGGSVTFTVTNNPSNTYQWMNGTSEISSATTNQYLATATGNYKLRVTGAGGCFVMTEPVAVTVNPIPTTPLINQPSSNSICSGDSVLLSISAMESVNYQWKLNGGNVGQNSHQLYAKASGTYSVIVSNTSNCSATSSNTMTITVNDVPTMPSVNYGETTFCQGGSVTFTVTNNPSNTYQWMNGTSEIENATTNQYLATTNGNYKLRVTGAGSCFVTTEPVAVTVNPIPTTPLINQPSSNSICSGDSVLLSISAMENVNYQWKLNGGNLGQNSNQLYAKASGTYSVIVSNTSNCSATSSNTMTITVNDIPAMPSVNYGETTFCQGGSVTFTVTNNPSNTYQWMNGTSEISSATTNQYLATATGNYKLRVTGAGGCFVMTEPVAVTVNPIPTTPLINQPSSNSICSGDSVLLSISAMESVNYQWKLNGGNVGQNSHQLYAKASGTYSVIVSNTSNCSATSSNTMTITVNDVPTMPSVNYGETTFCQGGSVTFTVTNNPSNTYQWMNGTSEIENATTNQYMATSTGNYKLRVTGAGGCFVMTEPVAVTVNPIPATPLINQPSSNSICSGDSVLLSISAMENVNYQWKLNGGNVGQNSHQLYAKASGTYSVIISNTSNCSATSSNQIAIQVNTAPTLPSVSYGATEFCQGNSVTFSVTNNPSNIYQWMNGTVEIPNANTNQLLANQTGNYWLNVSNSGGCAVQTQPVSVVVYPMPEVPAVNSENNLTSYCFGTQVKLMVSNTNPEFVYQWKRSGINIPGANQPVYEGKLAGGDYSVQVTSAICTEESNIITLTNKPAPIKPQLYARGKRVWILACDNQTATDYRWYYNGELIVGAKTYYYVANQNYGIYSVEVSEGGECYSMSDALEIAPPANQIKTLTENDVVIYPNPTEGTVNISVPFILEGTIDIQINNNFGNTLYKHEFADSKDFELNINDMQSGVYFCKIIHEGVVVIKKIVKL
jgi:hypothetical protein